ncbi:TPA: DUF86 domain-containing protein [Candidatus Poribacteria bacterium]|nr:DUF86 domain-containing protein [Candidatus Poribacteria bacterium]
MKDDKFYLIRILEYIERIEMYTNRDRVTFMNSPIVQDAVIRNFENIGESVKQISDELKEIYKDIPWRRIAGFRDVLAHNYLSVDMTEVWNVIENDLSALKNRIKEILEDIK